MGREKPGDKSVPKNYRDTGRAQSNNKISRKRTLFDAVAGRIGKRGLWRYGKRKSGVRDIPALRPISPFESLQTVREAKDPDITEHQYDAGGRSEEAHDLPDADLLKALHTYSSDFYARTSSENGKYDWRTMDETALLALGILIEETAAEMLGETGDMALVEPENLDQLSKPAVWTGTEWERKVYQPVQRGVHRGKQVIR